MSEWTVERVAHRFEDAAQTAHDLPPVRVRGYFNTWPAIVRQPWEAYADEEAWIRVPASPEAVDRMLETMRWVLWLEEEQRHLVWMRAERYDWKTIGRCFACDRITAWRRWQRALRRVAEELNTQAGSKQSESVQPARRA